ncbi:MAG: hypothetical protein ABIH82_01275 [Candidatus Woesearchaeota archaeon]
MAKLYGRANYQPTKIDKSNITKGSKAELSKGIDDAKLKLQLLYGRISGLPASPEFKSNFVGELELVKDKLEEIKLKYLG